jgi:hypothetical protein
MEIEEFVDKLQEWHGDKVAQLRQITENRDATIQLRDITLEPGSDIAAAFRAGVAVSLEILGKLPFSASHDDDIEDENS